jgi:methionyl-tRNA formyltransferase
MGGPEFAVSSLKILLDNDYPVVSVVTIPDKPQGRGQKVVPSSVKKFAIEHNLHLLQPESLKDPNFAAQLRALEPDLFVVVAFRILPKEIFAIPRLGAFNLHASLLPKYRGAAPIQWAIINGEKETGVTTFFLEEKVDTGNVILQARMPIGPDETFGELRDRLAEVGAEIVLHTVRLIEAGKAVPHPQDSANITAAPKILREHAHIEWTRPARHIHNLVRGLSPSPAAYTLHGGRTLKIFRTKVGETESRMNPGTICEAGKNLVVSTGEGTLEILEVQLEGRKKLRGEEFLRGYALNVGDRLE